MGKGGKGGISFYEKKPEYSMVLWVEDGISSECLSYISGKMCIFLNKFDSDRKGSNQYKTGMGHTLNKIKNHENCDYGGDQKLM